ncbi:MAG: hypothetical protein AAB486_05120 [Patescibacteria group bacterium]
MNSILRWFLERTGWDREIRTDEREKHVQNLIHLTELFMKSEHVSRYVDDKVYYPKELVNDARFWAVITHLAFIVAVFEELGISWLAQIYRLDLGKILTKGDATALRAQERAQKKVDGELAAPMSPAEWYEYRTWIWEALTNIKKVSDIPSEWMKHSGLEYIIWKIR